MRVRVSARDESVQVLDDGRLEAHTAVSFSLPVRPYNVLLLPHTAYRPASSGELLAAPALKFYPKDEVAAADERGAITAHIASVSVGPPPPLEFA